MRLWPLLALAFIGCGPNGPAPVEPAAPAVTGEPQPKRETVVLKPLPGELTSKVFDNEHLKIAPAIVYGIKIPFAKFKYQGSEVGTSLRLDRIRFAVAGWRELSGREFRFPVNPEDGYIDGSVYLGGAHNPADVTRIKFGELAEGRIPVELDVRIDFEFEGLKGLGKPSYTWQTELHFDPKELDGVTASLKK